MTSLSVNCMTRGPADRVAALLALFRPAADEIVVAVDDRAGAEVEGAFAGVADRILRYPYTEPVDRPLAWIHAQCEGEWVLTVDDDEIPSRALLDALPKLIRARDCTHHWLPRRWLYPTADSYLDARPWRPDYQPRLVLNDPRVLSFTAETHVPVTVLGPAHYLDTPLYHADLVLNPLEAREQKARRYERLHPGKRVAGRPLNEAFYLPERVDPPTRSVPAEDLVLIAAVLAPGPAPGGTSEVRAADRAEIDRLWAGRKLGDQAYEARLTLLEAVPPLRTGAHETVDVLVENLGDELWPWGGAGEPEIRLGSRWRSPERVVAGSHMPLPADLPPSGRQIVLLDLRAPDEPGSWTLEIDLVHEHVRWFGRGLEVEVEIARRLLVAVLDPGTTEGLTDVLDTLAPEEEPLVISTRTEELARSFGGLVVAAPEEPASRLAFRRLRDAFREALTGTSRLVVPAELLREGRRLPLLGAVSAAHALGIPAQTNSGEPLTSRDVAQRRLR